MMYLGTISRHIETHVVDEPIVDAKFESNVLSDIVASIKAFFRVRGMSETRLDDLDYELTVNHTVQVLDWDVLIEQGESDFEQSILDLSFDEGIGQEL